MSTDKIQRTIEEVDKALGKYYEALDKQEQYNKILENYCNENGIDDDGLKEDLEGDPGESVFDQIDDNFPIPDTEQFEDEEQKFKYIFNILKQCYDNPNQSWAHLTTGLPAFNKKLFDLIQTQDIEDTKKIYLAQCPSIAYQGINMDAGFLQGYVH